MSMGKSGKTRNPKTWKKNRDIPIILVLPHGEEQKLNF